MSVLSCPAICHSLINFSIIAENPTAKDLLTDKETIITPYYMAQLLQYGIGLGQAQNTDSSPDALLKEAEVRLNLNKCRVSEH